MRNTLRTLFALKHDVPALSDAKNAADNPEVTFLTVTGHTGDWSLWLNSEHIAEGTSRKQVSLSIDTSFSLEAKGYRVYVRGIYPEQDAVTGIRRVVSAAAENDRWYDLSGRIIQTPTQPGIYIHNGKKRVIN